VIEVADSSLDYDRSTKQLFYATAGIPVYWIANLIDKSIEVYEQPDSRTGKYVVRHDYAARDAFQFIPPAGSAIDVRVDEIIG
jgi:Uma2 family endonuclease